MKKCISESIITIGKKRVYRSKIRCTGALVGINIKYEYKIILINAKETLIVSSAIQIIFDINASYHHISFKSHLEKIQIIPMP